MTATREPDQLPPDEAPTVRLKVAAKVVQRRRKSALRRVARKILGPGLLTKRG